MRYLVISDIHANLTAFEAVLEDAKGDYDKIWCLGDIVGYGPHPNECVERLRELDHLCIAGNHDWAVIDKLDFEDFQPYARFVILWTQDILTSESYDYLDALPVITQEEAIFTLVHGSPRHPIWEYTASAKIAHLNFGHFDTPYCFVGHTHSPAVFIEADSSQELCDDIFPGPENYTHKLNSKRLILNPGSVGQPRDRDVRAAYGLLDTESMDFQIKRVSYDVNSVQKLMKQHKFPRRLWERLGHGY